MPWVRIDENAMEHPKISGLPGETFKLWVYALAHCQKFLTDGVVSLVALRGMRPYSTKRRSELVGVGLWLEREDGGIDVHDYLQWNESREQVNHAREAVCAGVRATDSRRTEAHEGSHPRCVRLDCGRLLDAGLRCPGTDGKARPVAARVLDSESSAEAARAARRGSRHGGVPEGRFGLPRRPRNGEGYAVVRWTPKNEGRRSKVETMPHTDAGLPFTSGVGSHTSYLAAKRAAGSRLQKNRRYIRLLFERGPLTDHETVEITGWPLQSVNSIRNGQMKGTRKHPRAFPLVRRGERKGTRFTWELTSEGEASARAMREAK